MGIQGKLSALHVCSLCAILLLDFVVGGDCIAAVRKEGHARATSAITHHGRQPVDPELDSYPSKQTVSCILLLFVR